MAPGRRPGISWLRSGTTQRRLDGARPWKGQRPNERPMNGFTAARRALLCAALAARCSPPRPVPSRSTACTPATSSSWPGSRTQLAAQGLACRRARALLRGWLAKTWSLAGEGLPRSTRRHHWQCRRGLAWSCALNGRRVRMVFRLELRRTADLVATLETAHGTGVAGERLRRLHDRGPQPGHGRGRPHASSSRCRRRASFWGATPSQGRCGRPDDGGLICALGSIGTGIDDRAAVTITMGYDCFSLDPIGPADVLVSSIAGDLDRSNNRAFVDERDRDCPDPLDTWFDEPDPAPRFPTPPGPEDPPPAPEDPAPPPED